MFSEATYLQWQSAYMNKISELSETLQVEVKDRLNEKYWRSLKTVRKSIRSRLDASPVGKAMNVRVWGEYGDIKMDCEIDNNALLEMSKSKGRYLLVSNKSSFSAVAMLKLYKDKDQVEKRFKILKQDMLVRPIYLHKDERIASMLLVNMIALLVYSLAERRCRQNDLHITSRQLLYEFASLHVTETHTKDGSMLCRSMPLTSFQQKIIHKMGLAGKTLLDTQNWSGDSIQGRQIILPPKDSQPLGIGEKIM